MKLQSFLHNKTYLILYRGIVLSVLINKILLIVETIFNDLIFAVKYKLKYVFHASIHHMNKNK